MVEPVRRTNHPWMAGVVIALIAGVYFYLLAKSDYPEPGNALNYDLKKHRAKDQVETRYAEVGDIAVDVAGPMALAIGGDGTVYVAGEEEIVAYDTDGTAKTRMKVGGVPVCLAALDGDLLVGVREKLGGGAYKNYVQVLDASGAVKATWDDVGPSGLLTSIAVSENDVFVADMGNRIVYRYDLNGKLLNEIGRKNPAKDIKGLIAPSPYLDLAVNDEGTLWVVNPGELGLESYRSNGDLITSWFKPSMDLDGFSGCCNPSHIAFNSVGKLITLEKGLGRVKKYEVTMGEFEELVAGSDLFPAVHSIKDLAVDAQDRILLLDPQRNAVRIFEQKDENDERTT